MRSGGYTLHQSLTIEAAVVVKQAVSLARRRGHAQVTPLHVAISMLSSPTSLLKTACLQSHSHPLQCKALDLCFNVALNRLPTSASTPLLIAPHSHLPSLSNALVAAFKRAQAHQRRGSIENQQQPILALKVEIEQLVISILDDPSVSRVMREAGFSSAQVKNNVVQAVKRTSRSQSKESIAPKALVLGNSTTAHESATTTLLNNLRFSSSLSKSKVSSQAQKDDVMSVLEAMMSKKTKNNIIVCECAASGESVVRGLIEKFDNNDVPADMKCVQFISVPLFSLRNISRDEFEVKIGELRSLVRSYANRGVVLYLGDIDWVSDYWSKYGEERDYNVYYRCPVEYMMITEISRLVTENKRVWLMGIASFHTYAKCKLGRPSLETLWSLHPLTIPVAGNLALSLSLFDSDRHDQVKKEPVDDCKLLFSNPKAEIKKQLSCCSDCSENFKREAHQAVMNAKAQESMITSASTSKLPSWLRQYKDENRKHIDVDQEFCDDKIEHLCEKWNSICRSIHTKPELLRKVVFNVPMSLSPSSSTSVSSNGLHIHKSLVNWPANSEPSNDHHQICQHDNEREVSKPNSPALEKPDLMSNPNSSPNSASSSEDTNYMDNFKELNSDNLNTLCDALETKVPWQRRIIPEIVSTILKCRSGMRKLRRQESWMFFLGGDDNGKESIARELARAVFGSHDDFVAVGISRFSWKRDHDSTEEASNVVVSNKRARDANLYDRFAEAIGHNPRRVFYVEDADQIDCRSIDGFTRAVKDGSVTVCDGGVALVKDAIVIFSCDEEKQCGLLDLNVATRDGNENGILDLVDHKVVFKMQV